MQVAFVKTKFSKFKGVEVQTGISFQEIADEFDLESRIGGSDEMEK